MHDVIPIISVVMAVYNGDEYLSAAVNSILEQTFDSFEFIIIDDGSIDASNQILNEYTDSRIKLIRQENKGLSAALNVGISIANGEYIARMDADDIALPNRLEVQYKYLCNNPELDVIGGQAKIIDMEGKVVADMRKPVAHTNVVRYMEYSCPLIHPTYLMKTSVCKAIGGYRPMFQIAQDYDFILRVVDAGYQCGNTPDNVLRYRVNLKNISLVYGQKQMYETRCLLNAHKLRSKGKSDQSYLDYAMKKCPDKNSPLFDYCLRLRTKCMNVSRKNSGLKKGLFIVFAVLYSCAHYEIFLSTYRIYNSQKYLNDKHI